MNLPPVTLIVLIVTGVMTALAFQRRERWERWMFKPFAVRHQKQFDRLLTSGFIHADWWHFGFNAFSFFSFGRQLEFVYGPLTLLAIYLTAILGGSLLSLALHAREDYRALGASGGVCGVIFASIFLLPGSRVMIFPFPVGIPPLLYAVVFLLGSYWAHRQAKDNVGHDAHLGGAMVGLLTATLLHPGLVLQSPGLFALVLGISGAILFLLLRQPDHKWNFRTNTETPAGGERARRYAENRQRNERLAEIDGLLDKVARNGIHSLSARERERLEKLSQELRR